ncbi:MAG: extracellular solute-binding protein [Oscillospiraceae bacterium]|nr:extracellular solute-binding protein [Oscillospiraceae bacterium]
MSRFVKRSIALVLALIIMSALAACGGSDGNDAVSEGLEGANLKVVIPSHPNWPYRDEWISWQYVREATKANIDIVAYPNADFSTKVPLILADPENVPDLICMPNATIVNQYVSQGAFVAIDDHMDKMPNYTNFWNSLPEEQAESMLRIRRAADGKTYFPQVYGRQDTINLRTWLYRKDIFEKNNIKTPETMDELYKAAVRLKRLYPDSYPLCIRGFFSNGVDLIGASWKPYFAYGAYYDFDNDEWHFGAREDTMLDIIKYFKRLVEEGLIPPNYVTMTSTEWTELVHADRIFIFPQYQVQIDLLNAESRTRNPDFTIAAMTPPRADTPTGQNMVAKSNVDPCGYVVCNSGNEKRISNALSLLDWFYSDEACKLLSWGKEGETYEVVDGAKRYILNDGENVESRYGFQTNSLIVRIEPEAVMAGFSEEQRNSTDFILAHTEAGYNPVRWVGFNEEEEAIRNEIGTALDTYAQEMISKFLLGTEPLSKWDDFVNTLNDMGVDKLLSAYESAYNRVK